MYQPILVYGLPDDALGGCHAYRSSGFCLEYHVSFGSSQGAGIFEEEGQDVEIVLTAGLRAVESLRAGAVDFSAGPAHAPIMIFPEWGGVKLVATISQGTPWMLVMKAGLAKRVR